MQIRLKNWKFQYKLYKWSSISNLLQTVYRIFEHCSKILQMPHTTSTPSWWLLLFGGWLISFCEKYEKNFNEFHSRPLPIFNSVLTSNPQILLYICVSLHLELHHAFPWEVTTQDCRNWRRNKLQKSELNRLMKVQTKQPSNNLCHNHGYQYNQHPSITRSWDLY